MGFFDYLTAGIAAAAIGFFGYVNTPGYQAELERLNAARLQMFTGCGYSVERSTIDYGIWGTEERFAAEKGDVQIHYSNGGLGNGILNQVVIERPKKIALRSGTGTVTKDMDRHFREDCGEGLIARIKETNGDLTRKFPEQRWW
ncbi:hypothetical protein HYU11_00805 [Candidatus Woesearchaeota archaeon]|nr:hypothetical protein [Candidatus Woesearchaeota archaeon]